MSEVLEREPIGREVRLDGGDSVFLTLGESGLDLWLGRSDWPHGFPLPVGRDQDWMAIQDAVNSIRAEAAERARMENAFQQLVDPIDGEGGEA